MKIVVNRCYGGFGLSDAAMRRYAELKGLTIYAVEDPTHRGTSFPPTWSTVPVAERGPYLEGAAWRSATEDERKASNALYEAQTLSPRDIPRNDPALVQVVEEMGNASSGGFAALEVVEIPDDVEWEIEEYDGREWVSETHRTW